MFSIYSLISSLISMLLHNIEQSFLPVIRVHYLSIYIVYYVINLVTLLYCSYTYFGLFQALKQLSKNYFSFICNKNLSIPEISFTPIKQQIWLNSSVLIKIDHGSILRWTMYSFCYNSILALSLQ